MATRGCLACARKQVLGHHLQRLARSIPQGQVEACELGHAADPDASVEARDRHLVRFVEDGRYRCAGFVEQRQRQRVALHRIDRQLDAQRPQHRGRMASERHDATVSGQALSAPQSNGGKAAGFDLDRIDGGVEAELDAQARGGSRQLMREQMAVSGFIVGQAEPAAESLLHAPQCRLGPRNFVAAQQFERHAEFTPWRWGRIVGALLVIGAIMKLMLPTLPSQ